MDKIFVVGSFVCDLVATMERFPSAGESVIGTTFNTFLGGKGANQLVSIHRLNGNVFIKHLLRLDKRTQLVAIQQRT